MSYVGGVFEELRQFDVDYLSVTHLHYHVKSLVYSDTGSFF